MAKLRRKSAVLKPVIGDVIIVGGGHAGLSLAACLGAAGLDVICLERGAGKTRQAAGFDGRTLALSFRSMRVLRRAGVAQLIEKDTCPILDIRIADQGSRRTLDFHHTEVGDHPFGNIIENPLFNRALATRIARLKNVRMVTMAEVEQLDCDGPLAQVTLADGRVFKAALVVGADGRKSVCRELAHIPVYGWDYGQAAIICAIAHAKPHHNVAVEHFQPGGPFATLPMTPLPSRSGTYKYRSGIVWTEKTEAAKILMQRTEADFIATLEDKVRDYLGKIKLAGVRQSYPLQLQHAQRYTAHRLALIGDAAHGIHPIAGQGFNLGMGDIEVLANEIIRATRLGLEAGSPHVLKRYEKRRKLDNGRMVLATDGLVKLFSNAVPPVAAARRLGLSVVQNMPRLRRFFIRTAMGARGQKTSIRGSKGIQI